MSLEGKDGRQVFLGGLYYSSSFIIILIIYILIYINMCQIFSLARK